LPADLVPDDMVSIGVGLGGDAENALRSATLEFMDTVRKVEYSIAASRRGEDVPEVLDIAQLGTVSEEEWRAHWPTLVPESPPEPAEPESSVDPVEPETDEAPEPEETPEELVADHVTEEEADAAHDPVAQANSVEPQ